MQLDQKALIEEAVQASIDAGLAVNGEYGVAAARHAARFMLNALQAVQPVPVVTEDAHQFKNFHRLLCERFGYCHDEKDWRRDQVSLIEHIAALSATASAEPVADEGTYEEGYDEGLRDAQGHAVEVTQAVARWLDNHLGAGNWYDQAEDGFTADDVIQGLFETVRDHNAAPLPAQGGKADE